MQEVSLVLVFIAGAEAHLHLGSTACIPITTH
jgi:hypothetical protein